MLFLVWSEWSDFTDCSETCTGGVQTRTRTCSLPDECEGDKRDVQECPIIGNCTSKLICMIWSLEFFKYIFHLKCLSIN